MKILAAIAFLAISAAAESKWMLEIHSSTDDDYFLADEKADEEFFSTTRLAWPDVDFWDKVGGARAESYEMRLEDPGTDFWIEIGNAAKEAEEATLEFPENDERAAPVAGISFKPSGFSSTERVSEVKPVEATPIETRAATKVARPDIWNL